MNPATSSRHRESLGDHESLVIASRADLGQRCLRTLVDVPTGAVIASFSESERVAEASYLTVQLGEGVHLVLVPDALEYVNHSCEPNVSFDLVQFALVALRPLAAGDELTYAYPSTEWTMTQPFVCACGAASCIGTINGASMLPDHIVARYALSPFVRAMLAQRIA